MHAYSSALEKEIVLSEQVQDFFSRQGILYIDTLAVDPAIGDAVKRESTRFLEAFWDQMADISSRNPHRESAPLPQLSLAYLGEAIGHGCFAAEPIRTGRAVREYAGILSASGSVDDRTY